MMVLWNQKNICSWDFSLTFLDSTITCKEECSFGLHFVPRMRVAEDLKLKFPIVKKGSCSET